ncbi:ParB/RepB/Spo0J family partition protein [Chlamydiifrater phoenicopteri]|uniref:ParB/RepB/Spo0J family partition protein n=1 Tax=Chlamydiifrater phoenicopteri TaxID=2681469 RepID=UPI001BCBE1BD|nr:ParB/RepB/Spo0J family partition protein [Chlamydiifrater phoenicopteri]
MDNDVEDKVVEVSVEAIRVSPFQPRKHFSEEELKELSQSLRSVGLIQPPVVREIKNGDRVLYYELIAGERRWRASVLAGFTTIPVLVRVSKDQIAAEATLVENLQRVNLNPMEMAEAFKKLIDVFGLTQDQVAKKVGKKRSTVANYLRLLTLEDGIKQYIRDGSLSLGHAKVVLMLEDVSLRSELVHAIVEKGLSVRDAELLVKKMLKEGVSEVSSVVKEKIALRNISEESIASVTSKFAAAFSSKVTIRSKGGKGTLSIHFENEEHLANLEKLLSHAVQ